MTPEADKDDADARMLSALKAINANIPRIFEEQAAIRERQRTIRRNQRLGEYAAVIAASVAITQLINLIV